MVIRATVKGSVLVAVAQGALGGLIFDFLGVHAAAVMGRADGSSISAACGRCRLGLASGRDPFPGDGCSVTGCYSDRVRHVRHWPRGQLFCVRSWSAETPKCLIMSC